MKLRVLSAAEAEVDEAAEWYEERQSGLGDRFIDDYKNTLKRVGATPGMHARIETARSSRNLRRCVLKRFPYYVAYELLENEIVVLAVAHSKRRPNYWVRRK